MSDDCGMSGGGQVQREELRAGGTRARLQQSLPCHDMHGRQSDTSLCDACRYGRGAVSPGSPRGRSRGRGRGREMSKGRAPLHSDAKTYTEETVTITPQDEEAGEM